MPLPKPRQGESRDTFISRCMESGIVAQDFPEREQRLAVCFDQWEEGRNNRSILSVHVDSPQMSEKRMDGRTYLVLPTVMMVEGVHAGSSGPILHKVDEFGFLPCSWNGRPVTLSHPATDDGMWLSANNPEVVDKAVVGQVFNTELRDNKLCGEIWVDVESAKRKNSALYSALRNREPIDVSIGVMHAIDYTPGEWNGEEYIGVAVAPYMPDHLALLPGEEGACSWQDGCGCPRVNTKEGQNMQWLIRSNARTPQYEGTEGSDWSGVSKDLEAYIKSYYKFNPDADQPDELPATADALPSAVKNWIAGKSLLGSSDANTADDLIFFPVVSPETNQLNENALDAVISGRGAQSDIPSSALDSARKVAYGLLKKEFGRELEPETDSMALKVLKKLLNLITVQEKEVTIMNKEKVVNGIIECTKNAFTEDDREYLMGLSEERLESIANFKVETKNDGDKKDEPAEKADNKSEEKDEGLTKDDLKAFMDDLKETINTTVDEKLSAKSKEEIIGKLTEDKDFPLSKETLQAMKIDELQKLADKFEQSAEVDFSARPGVISNSEINKDEVAAGMVMPAGITHKQDQ